MKQNGIVLSNKSILELQYPFYINFKWISYPFVLNRSFLFRTPESNINYNTNLINKTSYISCTFVRQIIKYNDINSLSKQILPDEKYNYITGAAAETHPYINNALIKTNLQSIHYIYSRYLHYFNNTDNTLLYLLNKDVSSQIKTNTKWDDITYNNMYNTYQDNSKLSQLTKDPLLLSTTVYYIAINNSNTNITNQTEFLTYTNASGNFKSFLLSDVSKDTQNDKNMIFL